MAEYLGFAGVEGREISQCEVQSSTTGVLLGQTNEFRIEIVDLF